MFPTFNEFRTFNDSWRDNKKKEHQHKAIVAIYYPFALIGLCLIFSVMPSIKNSIKNSSKYNYKRNPKYRKVIKEGILWDSVEYHER